MEPHSFIAKPEQGRRFAIGDVHGFVKTLQKLIENEIQPNKEDQLFFLGDYIDKGPSSSETVDYILALIHSGLSIYPLLGNHEYEKVSAQRNEPELLAWLFKKQAEHFLQAGRIKKKYFDFFESLPYYYETDTFYLVHACFNFNTEKPFEDYESMLQLRRFENNHSYTAGKTILHGHQPVNIEKIKDSITQRADIIGLDCGVNYVKKHKYYDFSQMGRLCALNMDTYELIVVKNCESD